MIVEYITMPRLLFEGKDTNLSYPIYCIIDRNSKGYLIGDTNKGKLDITMATKIATAKRISKHLFEADKDWDNPKHMMIVIKNADVEFLKDDVEIHIELIDEE